MARIQIDYLSVEEQLQLMESLWEAMRERAEQDVSPAWHHEVLEERRAALERGEIQSEDWEEAKRRILRETS